MALDALGEWRKTRSSLQITPDLDGKLITVFGWVQNIRDLGGIRFIDLGDAEGNVQITLPGMKVSPEIMTKLEGLKKQSVIGVRGIVKKSSKAERGVEVVPEEIRLLNTAVPPLGLDPSGRVPAEIDVRLNSRILDLRRPESRAIFRINHVVVAAIREFLSKHGCIEVFTPKLIATATEGGAALFPVVYFDREAFLAQSPQLYKEQLTSAFEKVFEIGPFFRAEESHTTRHTSEFISVDLEEAFVSAEDVMKRLEELVVYSIGKVKQSCEHELKALNQELPVPSLPFPRYSYDEILAELKQKDISVKWGEDIPTAALRTLGENHPDEFYFITDWPSVTKTFYIKPRDDKPEVSEGFDFMYCWVELASGGTRIHTKNLLIERMKQQGLKPENFDYHLKVFDEGMPPHAGWGLGLSRLVMAVTGRENVRECILFPRDRFRLIP